MFDIGFWELGLIGVVALVIIGPERLPAVARSIGKWVGGMQRFVSSVKTDINTEINKHEDLKQLIDEQKELKETHEILENTVGDLSEGLPVPSGGSNAFDNALSAGVDSEPSSASNTPKAVSEASKPDTGKSGAEDKQSHG